MMICAYSVKPVAVISLLQDERNTLLDLSKECKKALANLDTGSINEALLANRRIEGERSSESA